MVRCDKASARAAHNAAVMQHQLALDVMQKAMEMALVCDVVITIHHEAGTTQLTVKYSPERGYWIEDGQCARPRADGKLAAHLRVVR